MIAQAKRDYDLRKAANDKEVMTQKAISDLAKQLQEAKTRQAVKNEEIKVKIIKENSYVCTLEGSSRTKS